MKYHITAFFLGYLLDLLLGDPYWLYHPIRLIGHLILSLEKKLHLTENQKNKKTELRHGIYLVAVVLILTVGVTMAILLVSYSIHPYAGVFI